MRPLSTSLFFLLGVSVAMGQTLTPSRSYAWESKTGNLLSNWSCENLLQFWQENPVAGFTLNSHFKAATDAITAKTGSFVAKVSGTQSGGTYPSLYSEMFPLKASTAYTLSFYYQTKSTFSGTIRPVVKIYSDKGQPQIATLTGGNFASASAWTLSSSSFTTPADAQYASVILAEFATGTATLYFDDMVLEEGSLSSTQVQANRLDRSESVTFGDAFGRALQSQSKSNRAGDAYLVAGIGFDDLARPESTFLPTPYSLSAPAYQANLLAGAQAYYGASGPFNAKGYPFSRVQYDAEVGAQVVEASAPDSAWQMNKGHTVRQNYYFVSDTAVPSNIENPSVNPIEGQYRLDWSKDQDSSYSLTWTNAAGLVIRSARNITRSASGANNWKWAGTGYDYFSTGGVRSVYPPLDDSAGTSNFAEYHQYDSRGNAISTCSPDRNLKKAWYNRAGQIRYTQDEEQRAAGEYAYFDYDDQARLISEGVVALAVPPPQDSVDADAAFRNAELEEIGYIYDDTASFQARTGLTLQSVLGSWKNYIKVQNAPHRLFCKYNRNQDNRLDQYGPMDRLVADFFSYDAQGNVLVQWKYIGPIRDAATRLQDAWYTYDSQNRMTGFKNYTSAAQLAVADSQSYSRDFLGRIDTIRGIAGKPLASYTYSNTGALQRVTLGGTSSGDSVATLDYAYTSQGALSKILATGRYGGATRSVFKQFLGYETKAFPATGAPNPSLPKYDGSITQQLYGYTSDMPAVHPVRAVNYAYDQLGRMGAADAYWNTNAAPFKTNEDIDTSALSMGATDSLSSRFAYDLNGRIRGQRSGGVAAVDSAIYAYNAGSYALDHVNGKLTPAGTRNLSPLGTLAYDDNGALIRDQSKKMNVRYGWDGLPVEFSIDSVSRMGVPRCCAPDPFFFPHAFRVSYPTLESHNFYDADGNRVTRVQAESRPLLRLNAVHYVYMAVGMVKQLTEDYALSGQVKQIKAEVSLLGQSAMIGRVRADGKYEFFVKNHLGSTMVTVDDRGRYDNGRAMDYLAHGSSKDLKINTADPVTQKWTGKEFEAMTNLYAMGARWFDPELALFMSPDPAHQFANPYSYGGNPVNYVDPDGKWLLAAWVAVVVAAVVCEEVSDVCARVEKRIGDKILGTTNTSSAGVECNGQACNVTANGTESNPDHDTKTPAQKDKDAAAAANKASDDVNNANAASGQLDQMINDMMQPMHSPDYPSSVPLAMNLEDGLPGYGEKTLRGPSATNRLTPFQRALAGYDGWEGTPYANSSSPYKGGGASAGNGADCSGYYCSSFPDQPYRSTSSLPYPGHTRVYPDASSGHLNFMDGSSPGDTYLWPGHHVAWYYGNRQILHSSSSRGVGLGNAQDFQWFWNAYGVPQVWRYDNSSL